MAENLIEKGDASAVIKRVIVSIVVLGLMMAGCAKPQNDGSVPADSQNSAVETVEKETVRKILPLPDTTMENLTDAILAVSLEAGGAYVDENGNMQMAVTVYTYDQYDMVDISMLHVGDTIVRHSGEVEVTSKEQNEAGTIHINGGLDNDGFNLVTDDSGIFYEMGYGDSKNWYAIGNVTLPLSADFTGVDNADLDYRDLALTADSFLTGEVTNYDFTPYNTTIRVENGQVVELERRYTP